MTAGPKGNCHRGLACSILCKHSDKTTLVLYTQHFGQYNLVLSKPKIVVKLKGIIKYLKSTLYFFKEDLLWIRGLSPEHTTFILACGEEGHLFLAGNGPTC